MNSNHSLKLLLYCTLVIVLPVRVAFSDATDLQSKQAKYEYEQCTSACQAGFDRKLFRCSANRDSERLEETKETSCTFRALEERELCARSCPLPPKRE